MSTKEIQISSGVKRPVLACGADLKGAFAVAKGKRLILFEGFGDLSDLDNLTAYTKAIGHQVRKIKPAVIACDMHPEYFSSRYAEKLSRFSKHSRLFNVQHHEAHIASAIIDHDIRGDVIGVAFDGTGLGADGAIWGGEFFTGSPKRFIRAAHLKYVLMPGGEAAIREPWRMALSYLYGGKKSKSLSRITRLLAKGVGRNKLHSISYMIDNKINSPVTSSAGRLFDAAGSIILKRYSVSKEAQLPMELERIADKEWADSYAFNIERDGKNISLDAAIVMREILKDVLKSADPSLISGKFHNTVAEMILKTCLLIRDKSKLVKVILSGGVFQNRLLSDRVSYILGEAGFEVYRHSRANTNDNGIPVGQIAIANARALCV